jgi:competence protein ComEA
LSTGGNPSGRGRAYGHPVRAANNPDEVVLARLRAVLAQPGAAVRASPPAPDAAPAGGLPVRGDVVDAAAPAPGAAPARGLPAGGDVVDAAVAGDDAPAGGPVAAAGPRARLGIGAFDPGRRGVRALAVVAAVAVAVAAFLAWQARPRVEPAPAVAAAPAVESTPTEAPSSGAVVVVAVAGKVRKPGLVRLPAGARVADALAAAGGVRPGVDAAMLNPARKVVDGELIVVGATPPPGAAGPAAAAGGVRQSPLNLNTATLADLDTLPGVGPVLAQRIIDARAARGGFTAVSDLRRVSGIGNAKYEQLKDLVTV